MPIKINELINQLNDTEIFLQKNKDLAYTQKEIVENLKLDQSTITRQIKKSKKIESDKHFGVKGNPFYYYFKNGEK